MFQVKLLLSYLTTNLSQDWLLFFLCLTDHSLYSTSCFCIFIFLLKKYFILKKMKQENIKSVKSISITTQISDFPKQSSDCNVLWFGIQSTAVHRKFPRMIDTIFIAKKHKESSLIKLSQILRRFVYNKLFCVLKVFVYSWCF